MEIETYIVKNTFNKNGLDQIEKFGRDYFIPVILSETLDILLDVVKKNNPQNILEIGTAIGYSGSAMLLNSNAHLDTIEYNQNNFDIAKENFGKLDLSNRVTQYFGDAYKVLQELCSKNKKYDIIFVDGPKGQYIKYYPLIKNLSHSGTIIVCDDVLYYGHVINDDLIKHKHRTIVVNLRKFLHTITNDSDVDTEIYNNGNGMSITRIK